MGTDPDGDGKGEPVLAWKKPRIKGHFSIVTPAESDEFDSDTIGLQWQWQANPNILWSARIRGTDYLRLFAMAIPSQEANLWQVPNLLLQKFPAPDFTATAKVRLVPEEQTVRGGLTIFGEDYACIELAGQDKKIRLRQSVCRQASEGGKEIIVKEIPLETDTVFLRVQVTSPDAVCRFSYSTDGRQFTPVGESFTARPGRWIGAKVGLYCLSQAGSKAGGYLDADWFRIE
jgi:beta-xylosidase